MAIRVGIIGTGFGAGVHVPILKKHPAYDVVSIASMRQVRAAKVATDLEICNFRDDWREMLRADSLDLDVITTKPTHHAEMSHVALKTSHNVLCEKPPALGVAEVEFMAKTAQESGNIAAMNFQWRYLPERQAVERILDEHRVGDIIHVNWSAAWPLWSYIQHSGASWDWQTEEGGGMLGALGSHIIDALYQWFGPFASIQGQTINHVPKRKSGTEWVSTTAEDSFAQSITGETRPNLPTLDDAVQVQAAWMPFVRRFLNSNKITHMWDEG